MRLALLTDRTLPALSYDDRPLPAALAGFGFRAEPVAWDAPVDWATFDAVLVRSPWDWFGRWPEFSAWLDRVGQLAIPTLNPLPVLRWNAEKSYLRDLAADGVPVTPTAWLAAGAEVDLGGLLDERGWGEVVVKPAVSAWGVDTVRARRDDLDAARALLARRLPADPFLVQPFLAGVLRGGEQSFTFVEGEHWGTVTKRPAPGGFLVHEEYGGRTDPAAPAPGFLDAAEATLAAVTRRYGPLLYARVDLLAGADGPRVVEVELLEPELFLRFIPDGYRRFAAAVRRRLPG